MVEVGVYAGDTCRRVIASHPNVHMILVDPWEAGTPESSWCRSGSKMAKRTQDEMEALYINVMRLMGPYAGRVTVHRAYSEGAAVLVPDSTQDLVFIDADHSYESVKSDIELWLPKVKAGGYIGGHDYKSPRFPGVAQAVHEAFARGRIEPGENCTWFVRV